MLISWLNWNLESRTKSRSVIYRLELVMPGDIFSLSSAYFREMYKNSRGSGCFDQVGIKRDWDIDQWIYEWKKTSLAVYLGKGSHFMCLYYEHEYIEKFAVIFVELIFQFFTVLIFMVISALIFFSDVLHIEIFSSVDNGECFQKEDLLRKKSIM